jgi:hypothetical protein
VVRTSAGQYLVNAWQMDRRGRRRGAAADGSVPLFEFARWLFLMPFCILFCALNLWMNAGWSLHRTVDRVFAITATRAVDNRHRHRERSG